MKRYVPLLRLAMGSMADVYLGVLRGAEGYEKPVVLKRAYRYDEMSADDEGARAALIAEARVGSALDHPNLVHFYELFEAEEGLMLAMEYIPGISLAGVVERLAAHGAVMPWPIAARITCDAARGLSHAHSRAGIDGRPLGIVHRDVKPRNLIVREDGWTKIVDFNIARSALREHTTEHIVKGTPGYLSPEQASGGRVDHRSDVYSLGVVLYELLANRRHDDPVSELPPSVPAPLRELCREMRVADPAHRTADLRDAARLLDDLSAGAGGTHADVAAFLTAELDDVLADRRRRIAAALRGTATAIAVALPDETATFALLEPALTGVRLAEGDATEVDPAAGSPLEDLTDVDFDVDIDTRGSSRSNR